MKAESHTKDNSPEVCETLHAISRAKGYTDRQESFHLRTNVEMNKGHFHYTHMQNLGRRVFKILSEFKYM